VVVEADDGILEILTMS